MTRRSWTSSDDAALRAAVAARRSAAEIAPDLGRSRAAIRMRMTKLRLRLYPALTRADVDTVAEMYAVGTPLKRIAARLGVRPAQVVHVVRSEGLVNARSYSVGDELPFDAEIQRLSSEGLRVAEIARRVGQPAVRVRGRLVTLARCETIAEANSNLSSSRRMFAASNKQENA